MPPNPLLLAHRHALRDDRWLRRAFARFLGSAKHPRGAVLSAYRRARREMKRALRPGAKLAPSDVLFGLRSELTGIAYQSLREASARGVVSGTAQAAAYRADGARIIDIRARVDNDVLLDAWFSGFYAQERTVRALLPGGDPATIIGDAGRMGALAPGVVLREGARWIATALHSSAEAAMGEPLGDAWGKQALPNIDDVTTDCCLSVAGQIQPLDSPFQLTGEPRFADELDWTPFHWYCRTSVALYREGFDVGVTTGIRSQVGAERARRQVEADA